VLELLPAGVFVCDAEGLIRYHNRRATELLGRMPRVDEGNERFCDSFRAFTLDGILLPPAESPMAEVLRTGQPCRNREVIVERPDGSRLIIKVNIDPIRNEAGDFVGAINVFQDITNEKRLAEVLGENEERLRGLLSALPVAVYTTDCDGRITFYNEAAAELWGRRPELNKDMWCGSYRILRPEDGAPMPLDQCPMAVTLNEGRSVRGEEILIERPDGSRSRVLPHPEPLRDASGTLIGAVNMLADVTSHKRTEEELRKSEARFRSIVEATPECIKLLDPEGTLLEMNEVGLGMVEAEWLEDVVGRSFFDLIVPEHREAFRAFHEQVCRGESMTLEFDIIGLKGTRRTMESHAVPLPNAEGRLMHLAVSRDMTEKKRAGVERNLLAAIIASSDDAIISKDLQGTITSWNKGAEQVFGYKAEEIIGKSISTLIPPDEANDFPSILDRIRRGERVEHYQTRRKTKDGRILDISLTVSPVRDAAGRIVGASKVARDITHQKQAEASLRRSEEQLREMNLRKDEFLAMLAHELRNPLSAINSAVRLARKSELTEPLEWSTRVIERQVKQLARLIDDLLDVARIIRGKIQLHEEVVDIGPVLNSAVDTVRPLVEERKHDLVVSLRSGALRVKADPVRLEQIVVNLLTNAAKYTESGGHIWLSAEQRGNDVAIRVRDTGIGIPPEKIPQMFELFVQGDRSLARSEGGLGIGLTLVQKLVEIQGGAVTATSGGPGEGSEFFVRFPAVASPARIDVPTRAIRDDKGKQASRILIVDDNADSARGLARLLKLLGHEVLTAQDGQEATAAAEAYRPDFVLLDIGLPGMDGYEVARQLRRSETCRKAVIVGVSGYGQDDDRRRAREAGFNHHLVKPIDHDSLLTLLSAGRESRS
jgi:PAS domain S-box-containing protein